MTSLLLPGVPSASKIGIGANGPGSFLDAAAFRAGSIAMAAAFFRPDTSSSCESCRVSCPWPKGCLPAGYS